MNVLAAIGLAQMENFEIILNRKRIDYIYRKEFSRVGDIIFQEIMILSLIVGYLHFEQKKWENCYIISIVKKFKVDHFGPQWIICLCMKI